jgi:hypothetical protein
MKKIISLFLTVILLFHLNACKETEPTNPNEQKLANKDWNTDGVYVGTNTANPTLTISPNIKLRFKNITAAKTIALNGTDLSLSATWSLSADATQLTVKYPTISGNTVSFASQVLKVVKLEADQLWVTAPDGQNEIKLLGLITITNTMQYRFTTASGSGTSLTNATLTGATWSGNLNDNAGIFLNGVRQSGVATELKFQDGFGVAGQTFFPGTNIVLVSGIPTTIWGINNASNPTQLTFAIPTGGAYINLAITKLTTGELWLKNNGASTISIFGVITLNANN